MASILSSGRNILRTEIKQRKLQLSRDGKSFFDDLRSSYRAGQKDYIDRKSAELALKQEPQEVSDENKSNPSSASQPKKSIRWLKYFLFSIGAIFFAKYIFSFNSGSPDRNAEVLVNQPKSGWLKTINQDPFNDRKVIVVLQVASADRVGTLAYGCANDGNGKIEEMSFWRYSNGAGGSNAVLGMEIDVAIRFDDGPVSTEKWKWIPQQNNLQPKDGGLEFFQKLKGKKRVALKETTFSDQVGVFDISGFDSEHKNALSRCKN
jgi:hypothetical protein